MCLVLFVNVVKVLVLTTIIHFRYIRAVDISMLISTILLQWFF